MNAAVGLMDGLGLDGDRCIRVIPRQFKGFPLKYMLCIYCVINKWLVIRNASFKGFKMNRFYYISY